MDSNQFKSTCRDLCKKLVNIENTECIICHDEIKVGTLLLPCNHYQLCLTCYSLNANECSICRTKIDNIVNYYKSDEYGKDIFSLTDSINYQEYLDSVISKQ